MAELTITECSVFTRVGANLQPSIGYATFSDGKAYKWSVSLSDGSIEMEGRRGLKGYRESFSLKSPKRSQLVKEWLEKNG